MVILLVAACLLSPAVAQSGELTLGGTVVNAQTGAPLARAMVQIVRFGAPQPLAPGQRRGMEQVFSARTLTDAAGMFQFSGLAAGDYSISAQKPEFVAGNRVSLRNPVNLAASVADVKLSLSPLGVISGRVVDQEGQPVWAASLVAVRTPVEDGLKKTKIERTVSTDDRGMFRMWSLTPGRYYLKAAGRGFEAAYFGGGRTLDSAAPLEIQAGTEMRADLTVKTMPGYAIRGSLGNFAPHRTVNFELLMAGESLPAIPVGVNAETGRFEIEGVTPGQYTLHAVQDNSSADVSVTVEAADVNGIALVLYPAVDVKIVTRVTNPLPPDAPENRVFGAGARFQGASCTVMLHTLDGRAGERVAGARAMPDGKGLIAGVPPGRYLAVAICFGGYAQTVMWGRQDVLANPVIAIAPGSEAQPIEIVATRGGGTIAGTLAAELAGKEPVTLLAAPQFGGSTGPVTAMALEDSFEIGDLAPGAYVVYAWTGKEGREFRNPAVLRSLTGGVSVQVEDGSTKEITIARVVQ